MRFDDRRKAFLGISWFICFTTCFANLSAKGFTVHLYPLLFG